MNNLLTIRVLQFIVSNIVLRVFQRIKRYILLKKGFVGSGFEF